MAATANLKNKSDEPEINTPELFEIQELKKRFETPDSVFCGVTTSKGWRPGKMVTEEEYRAAVDGFLKSPTSGRTVRSNAKRR